MLFVKFNILCPAPVLLRSASIVDSAGISPKRERSARSSPTPSEPAKEEEDACLSDDTLETTREEREDIRGTFEEDRGTLTSTYSGYRIVGQEKTDASLKIFLCGCCSNQKISTVLRVHMETNWISKHFNR